MSYEKLGFTSGQLLKADHLNHIENGFENISWNDLTDKPFEETISEAYIVPETTVTIKHISVADMYCGDIVPPQYVLFVEGKQYVVTLDGIEYPVVATLNSINKPILAFEHEGVAVEIKCTDSTTNYTIESTGHIGTPVVVSIRYSQETVRTIDPNYLPKAAAVADVTSAPTAENFNALLASLRAAGYLAE